MIVDVEPDTLVVTKRAETGGEAEQLVREAAALDRARHPGVPHLLAIDTNPAVLRIGPVPGRRLTELQGVNDLQVAGLGAVLATILADLHDIGVAHGALMADHIAIDATGQPMLTGLASGTPSDDTAGLARVLLAALPPDGGDREGRALRRLLAKAGRPDSRRRPTARRLARRLVKRFPAATLLAAPASGGARPAPTSQRSADQAGPIDIQRPGEPAGVKSTRRRQPVPTRQDEAGPARPDHPSPAGPGRLEPAPDAVSARPAGPGGRDPSARSEPPPGSGASGPAPRPRRTAPYGVTGPAPRPTPTAPDRVNGAAPRPTRTAPDGVTGPAPRPTRTAPDRVNGAAPRPTRTAPHGVNGAAPRPTRTAPHGVNGAAPRPTRTAPDGVNGAAARMTRPRPRPRWSPAAVAGGLAAAGLALILFFTPRGPPTGRYRIGRPGDRVVVGRWQCRTPLAALLRPATGEVWVFDAWAGRDRPIPGRLVARADGAVAIRADPAAANPGCDRLLVIRRSGPPVAVDPNRAD